MTLKKFFLATLAVTFVLFNNKIQAKSLPPLKNDDIKSVNGGTNCAGCTIVVALVEQLSIVYNQTIEKSLDNLCEFLPPNSIFKVTCLQAIVEFGPMIINGYFSKNSYFQDFSSLFRIFLFKRLYEKETPDVVCHSIPGFCKTDPGQPECHIFPKPKVIFLAT